MTLSPALCAAILKSDQEKADFKFLNTFNNWFDNLRDKYVKNTEIFINSPILTLISLVSIIIITLGLFYIIPKGFLPTEDRGAVFTQIQLQDGSTATRTDEIAKDVEEKLLKIRRLLFPILNLGQNVMGNQNP